MPDTLTIDRGTTALLVMDFQAAIGDGFAADKEALLGRAAPVL